MILHFCRFASCTLVIRSLCAAIFEMMYELTGSSVQRMFPNSLDKPIQESWQLFASFLCRGSYHPQSTCFHMSLYTFLCFYRSELVIAIWMPQPVLQGIGEWVNFDWAPIPKDFLGRRWRWPKVLSVRSHPNRRSPSCDVLFQWIPSHTNINQHNSNST